MSAGFGQRGISGPGMGASHYNNEVVTLAWLRQLSESDKVSCWQGQPRLEICCCHLNYFFSLHLARLF